MFNYDDLTGSEKELICCAKQGRLCEFGEEETAAARDWSAERLIRADVIYNIPARDLRHSRKSLDQFDLKK